VGAYPGRKRFFPVARDAARIDRREVPPGIPVSVAEEAGWARWRRVPVGLRESSERRPAMGGGCGGRGSV